jgi:trimeric autotransporter adhesin
MTVIARWSIIPVAALALVASALMSSPAAAEQRVGVNSAVNPDATGAPPGAATRKLVIGQEVVHNEHIVTTTAGQAQILFLDESALTVAPNSDMTIDDFVYNPDTGKGELAMSAVRGVLRFVGGKLSKNDNAVTLVTPTATLAVRGGVFLMNLAADGRLDVVFVYGKELTVTGTDGVSQKITRPGFAVSVASRGAAPSNPAPAPPGTMGNFLTAFGGHTGSSAGATTAPTDATVANSGVATTISGNFTASVQDANQNQPPSGQPQQVNVGTIQNNLQVNTVSTAAASSTAAAQAVAQQVVIEFAGAIKDTVNGNNGFGFIDQSVNGRIPYSSGTILYPAGSVLQNGFGTITIPNQGQTTGVVGRATLFPLTPGSTTSVTATLANGNTATGTAYTSLDSRFFYANLIPTNNPTENAFVFGGVPVSQSFYAPTPTQQFYAFNVQPDAALANGSKTQIIPFLPVVYGGAIPNASVSPLLVATTANEQFGISNNVTHNDGLAPKWLQASLAINGQGANQTSALVVGNGGFSTSSDNGQVIVGGLLRGTVMNSATSPAVLIGASVHSVPDANNNSLFGGNTIDGFVLDQNDNNITGNFVPNLASAAQFGQTTTNYAFNQPVTAAGTFTPGTRSALSETGFFGGIMTHTTNPTTGSPYALSGGTIVQTDPVSNRVAATFTGADPFTAAQSGIHSMVLQFGSLPSASISAYGRSVFIDNNNYSAMESPVTPSQINGNNLPTYTTAANPTMYAPGEQPPGSGLPNLTPSLEMVTSATVPNNWMPAGVTPCSCQYLQWGYWSGQLLTPNASLTASTRDDRAFINTWLAGMPTVTMPASGVGTYNGAAVGTVFNNGATYLAAGNFSQTYNFGSNIGTVNITNFDNASYTFGVTGSGRTFTGGLTVGPPNRGGNVAGGFFGPGAIETGGNFGIQSTAGLRYIASGIFAGR